MVCDRASQLQLEFASKVRVAHQRPRSVVAMTPFSITVCLAVVAAIVCTVVPRLRAFAFGIWIAVAFLAPMQFPTPFLHWGVFDLKVLIVPLIQIIMFGMGTTLTTKDFARALQQPKPVFIGIAAQFLVMPLVGWCIGAAFGLAPEVQVGVILIGSVSGGVASNLMVFLARGDVALSVTMTACSTMLSPIMTPLLMKLLAGTIVPIPFLPMMFSILNMIIAPILAGLLAHEILYSSREWSRKIGPLTIIAVMAAALRAGFAVIDSAFLGNVGLVRPGFVVGLFLIALVSVVKVVAIARKDSKDWIGRALPFVSMIGIWLIIAIITARSRETLLAIGGLLIVAAVIHNTVGYLLGYGVGRVMRLPERTCRTIAFEVGMQNGGMAAGLAMDALKSAPAALAPAIFGPWMNISGSLLASWWRRSPEIEDQVDAPETECVSQNP